MTFSVLDLQALTINKIFSTWNAFITSNKRTRIQTKGWFSSNWNFTLCKGLLLCVEDERVDRHMKRNQIQLVTFKGEADRHRNNCSTGLLWGLLEMYGSVGVVVMVCVRERETNFWLGITNEFKAGNTPFRP